MGRRRRYFVTPPVGAEHVAGEGYEFKPDHDRVNAGKPPLAAVEFLGTGPSTDPVEPAFVFKPEHDRVAVAAKLAQRKAERRAAFLAELERCNTVEGARKESVDHALQIRPWKDVIPDPSVWEALTEFLLRTNLVDSSYNFLPIGRGPLATYWLTTDAAAPNGWTFKKPVLRWLSENWRGEWARIGDHAKLALVEHFAKAADRSEGLKDALHLITVALRPRE